MNIEHVDENENKKEVVSDYVARLNRLEAVHDDLVAALLRLEALVDVHQHGLSGEVVIPKRNLPK